MEEAKKFLDDVTWCTDAYDALNGTDAVVIVTEWNEFRSLDFDRMKETMKSPILVDLRNIYDAEHVVSSGIVYSCVGRPNTAVLGRPTQLYTMPEETTCSAS